MNSKIITSTLISLLILVLWGTSLCMAEVTFIDSAGTSIILPEPAERVVCLNSDAAEMMVAIGAGAKVGRTD